MTFTHASTQKWYYLDQHRTDEVTMIKIWDSLEGVATSKSFPLAFLSKLLATLSFCLYADSEISRFSVSPCGVQAS